jgi:Amt family ammonium transporter
VDEAIPVVNRTHPGTKITKITIITNQDKFSELQTSLDKIGITGLTVTNVLGYVSKRANGILPRCSGENKTAA